MTALEIIQVHAAWIIVEYQAWHAVRSQNTRLKRAIFYIGLRDSHKVFDYMYFHSSTAKLNELNFHPLEVVSRYRDPQLQVGENYSYLFILRPNF